MTTQMSIESIQSIKIIQCKEFILNDEEKSKLYENLEKDF